MKQKEFYYKFDLDTYKDGFSLPGLSKNILFQFAQKGFQEYLKSCPDVETSKFSYPKNIYKKITSYIEQDIKASRSLDNYIREDEIKELFKKQKFVCYYCWGLGIIYSWTLDRIDCSKGHLSGNCVVAHEYCNIQTRSAFIPKFYRKKRQLDKQRPIR